MPILLVMSRFPTHSTSVEEKFWLRYWRYQVEADRYRNVFSSNLANFTINSFNNCQFITVKEIFTCDLRKTARN